MEYLTKEKMEETPYLKYYLMKAGRLKLFNSC